MEDVDKDFSGNEAAGHDDEEQFLRDVIQGDHSLLYIDTYLREILK